MGGGGGVAPGQDRKAKITIFIFHENWLLEWWETWLTNRWQKKYACIKQIVFPRNILSHAVYRCSVPYPPIQIWTLLWSSLKKWMLPYFNFSFDHAPPPLAPLFRSLRRLPLSGTFSCLFPLFFLFSCRNVFSILPELPNQSLACITCLISHLSLGGQGLTPPLFLYYETLLIKLFCSFDHS